MEQPDFVIVSVPWQVTPELTVRLVEQAIPVLAETPPAPDLPGLPPFGSCWETPVWSRSPSSIR